MRKERIYLCLAHMGGREMDYIREAFDSNWVVPMGPNVNGFEEDLERFVNGRPGAAPLDRRVACLSSGTAAVHLALIGCGVGLGDEVIVQSFTFCASSHPVTYLGAVPVFVDSEKETWNMDPELLEEAIRDRIAVTGRKPKAIIPVALYGMPYRIDRIMDVADRYGIPVIEDAAEGFGSRFGGQVLGTFGRYGVLSFNGNKMITTSGGGALICSGKEAKDEMLFYATQAREGYPYYQHEKIGYNYRMSNICAGIGRGQMEVLDEHISHHRHVQALYCELLDDVEGIEMHCNPSLEIESNFWLCAATLDPALRIKGEDKAYGAVVTGAVGGASGVVHAATSASTDCQPSANVEALRVWLDSANVEARPLWKPMHRQPVYKDSPAYVNGVSDSLFRRGICLPAGPYVSDENVRYIVECIKSSIA
ncbi:MAG: aminotransferase class I/II-fold pyridoxal phosphate-dependent enzyme [Muribaculaceae bacterium]|nr:aminotransferase class I/II-fold pyridoxal phosphate-dependent enzyme [Muribaculaceae bacterium]MDE6533834.1 aminotransferase class I/II-fold pyridoxal phosphate-dependent enzyme [Muribaculaceae bacterium]